MSLPGVVDLTPDNFDTIVNGAKHVLVEFYAPWCGHCKRMTPEFKKLGEVLESDASLKSRVVVGKVNADSHRELGTKFGVQGFPTILYFARGKPVTQEGAGKYEGARTSDKFLEFLKKKLEEDATFARVPSLDEVAEKFAAADKAGQKKLVAEAEKAVTGLKAEEKSNGELYVKFMKKALEKGEEFFKKEHSRLERMVGSGSVAAAKVDEMLRKTSVLGAFLPEAKEQ